MRFLWIPTRYNEPLKFIATIMTLIALSKTLVPWGYNWAFGETEAEIFAADYADLPCGDRLRDPATKHLVTKDCGPVIKWVPDKMFVTSGPAKGAFGVTAAFNKLRDDCPVSSWEARAIDMQGFAHSLTTTIGKTGADSSDEVQVRRYFFRFDNPKLATIGRAKFEGTLVYACPEGNKIVTYPNHMKFFIEKPRR